MRVRHLCLRYVISEVGLVLQALASLPCFRRVLLSGTPMQVLHEPISIYSCLEFAVLHSFKTFLCLICNFTIQEKDTSKYCVCFMFLIHNLNFRMTWRSFLLWPTLQILEFLVMRAPSADIMKYVCCASDEIYFCFVFFHFCIMLLKLALYCNVPRPQS